ncbi:glycoside hydrolase family 76 protein [Arthrobacter caoxuetaonis]|uniref:Glycosyl hydrolase n=1 Tax=Arthrobacter caoxuetaonis TaxID=2886935 RepID=A0A9X1MEM7_9MICC|nr:glycoside hydrolase family 76 protein [Arthrobacter caoxuetaonis]MCC3298371.1 glycosyl hydrolase [Arthrobacter caoxuetaonis]USQ57613.1 glycosyl hydrolase [Arthrobacter caoxuetaonis]
MPSPHMLRSAELRADTAAHMVTTAFGGRLFGIPGTHLAAVRAPQPLPRGSSPWHYWWQAHYADLLVDTGLRNRTRLADMDPIDLADTLVRTIRLRNYGRWTNHFYDDMAWLVLAALRLDSLPGPPRGPKPRHQRLRDTLGSALRSAHTPEFGGGLYWNRSRNFKNTPATAPAALYFARSGDRERAQNLIDWLGKTLLDQDTGLYFDGVRRSGGQVSVETALYTYNQGPVLGALLELGGAANLERAADLVRGTAAHLAQDDGGGPVLRTHNSGDGGLFTGILCRYLAEAAAAPTLDESARQLAGSLVTTLAERLWQGRATRNGLPVFSPDPRKSADESYPPGGAVELSTQLQAWMVMEAAVRVVRVEAVRGVREES